MSKMNISNDNRPSGTRGFLKVKKARTATGAGLPEKEETKYTSSSSSSSSSGVYPTDATPVTAAVTLPVPAPAPAPATAAAAAAANPFTLPKSMIPAESANPFTLPKSMNPAGLDFGQFDFGFAVASTITDNKTYEKLAGPSPVTPIIAATAPSFAAVRTPVTEKSSSVDHLKKFMDDQNKIAPVDKSKSKKKNDPEVNVLAAQVNQTALADGPIHKVLACHMNVKVTGTQDFSLSTENLRVLFDVPNIQSSIFMMKVTSQQFKWSSLPIIPDDIDAKGLTKTAALEKSGIIQSIYIDLYHAQESTYNNTNGRLGCANTVAFEAALVPLIAPMRKGASWSKTLSDADLQSMNKYFFKARISPTQDPVEFVSVDALPFLLAGVYEVRKLCGTLGSSLKNEENRIGYLKCVKQLVEYVNSVRKAALKIDAKKDTVSTPVVDISNKDMEISQLRQQLAFRQKELNAACAQIATMKTMEQELYGVVKMATFIANTPPDNKNPFDMAQRQFAHNLLANTPIAKSTFIFPK